MTEPRVHWDEVYRSKAETELSWFQKAPERSFALIREAAPDTGTSIIDVGGGASRLTDVLLKAGYGDVTVFDISERAVNRSKARLGAAASQVNWLTADITKWAPGRTWQVWHDRAAFHFQTDAAGQNAYIAALRAATGPHATIVIATFALDGPERCSGLPVQRYSPETLAARLGPDFRLIGQQRENHTTPTGAVQKFQYAVLRRC